MITVFKGYGLISAVLLILVSAQAHASSASGRRLRPIAVGEEREITVQVIA